MSESKYQPPTAYMQPSQATALKCRLCCGFTREEEMTQNGWHVWVILYRSTSWRLSYLHQWGSTGPCTIKGVKSKGSHPKLPASPNTLPVSSNDVQVVIEDHCGETPLVSPERELCNRVPASALLRPLQCEDTSCRFCLWVVPGSQVLLPEAAQTLSSLHPEADNFILLFSAQITEARFRF